MKTTNFTFIGLAVSLLCLAACGTHKQTALSPRLEDGRWVYSLPDSELTPEQRELKMSYVDKIPDYLRTSEQEEMVKELEKVVADYVKVENNRMVLRLSRRDFQKTSTLPEVYYDRLKSDVKTNNRFIKENNVQNIEEMFRKALEK